MKARTTISIDMELLKLAQEKKYNVSGLAEDAIKKKHLRPDIDEIKELKCEFCGNAGETETIGNVNCQNKESQKNNNAKHPLQYSEPTKLTWLWPDDKWVCNRCLKIQSCGVNIC